MERVDEDEVAPQPSLLLGLITDEVVITPLLPRPMVSAPAGAGGQDSTISSSEGMVVVLVVHGLPNKSQMTCTTHCSAVAYWLW